jgi:hypothetical protein
MKVPYSGQIWKKLHNVPCTLYEYNWHKYKKVLLHNGRFCNSCVSADLVLSDFLFKAKACFIQEMTKTLHFLLLTSLSQSS